MIPAILKYSCGGFGIFPIAEGDVGAAYQHLFIVCNAHFHARKWLTHGTQSMLGIRCYGDHGRAFGGSVALHDAKAHSFPFLGKGGRQIGSATDEETEMPTKTFVYRPEEQTPPAKGKVRGNFQELLKLFLSFLTT